MEMIPAWGWLLVAYMAGTYIGYFWGRERGALYAAEGALDALIAGGFIKSSTDENGEIQIHKWDEEV
jgi:hypothetical protein